MYFDNYVYGNIRVDVGELRMGRDPQKSLVVTDMKGADIKDNNGNGFLLLFNKGQKLFVINNSGYVYTGILDAFDDETGCMILNKGYLIDTKNVIFVGELRD